MFLDKSSNKIGKKEVKPLSNNKFMKILIACGVTVEQLTDFEWFVDELEPHKYHCIGYHPIASRIDIIKSNIVIQ